MTLNLSAQNTWQMIYNAPEDQQKLEVLSPDNLIVLGESQLSLSADGGQNWKKVTPLGSDYWLTDMDFPNNQIGYLCGGSANGDLKAFVCKTTDGGKNWSRIYNNVNDPFYSATNIEFSTEEVGFVSLSGNGGMLKTVDGGQSFFHLLYGINVTDIVFVNSSTGFLSTKEMIQNGELVNQVNKIYRTYDQGINWEIIYEETAWEENPNDRQAVIEMDFVNESVGYAVGNNNLFLKTIDGGTNWEALSLGTENANLTAVDFITEQIGYLNLEGKAYKTTDGGSSFMEQEIMPKAKVCQIKMIDERMGYMIGQLGLKSVFKYDEPLENLIPIGLEELTLYLNPEEKNQIILELGEEVVLEQIELYDIRGRLIKSFSGFKRVLDISDVSMGHYFVRVLSLEGEVTKKIIVE